MNLLRIATLASRPTSTSILANLHRFRLQRRNSSILPVLETPKTASSHSLSLTLTPTAEAYYPRQRHAHLFTQVLNLEPTGLTLLIGPPNIGKTTFVRNILQDRPKVYIDLQKSGNVFTVDQFVRLLQSQFVKWSKVARDFTEKLGKYLGGVKAFGFEIPKNKVELDIADLSELLKNMDEFLERCRVINYSVTPVVVIDGAHRLKNLLNSPGGIEVLKSFFQWAIATTKVEKACHFVLVSDHGFFVKWLQYEFGYAFDIKTFVFSELDKIRSYDFMYQYFAYKVKLHQQEAGVIDTPGISITEPNWDKVYSNLGGSIFHLKDFINSYINGISEDSIIDNTLATSVQLLQEALLVESFPVLKTRGPVLWTRGQWVAVMKEIVNNNGICKEMDLITKIFNTGRELESLINYGLLYYRPPHVAAVVDHDIHESAITVSNYITLVAMRHVVNNLPKPILTLKVKEPATDYFYEIDLNEITMAELSHSISQVFTKPADQIVSLVLLPDTIIYREKDMLSLRQNDELLVFFSTGLKQEANSAKYIRRVLPSEEKDFSRAFGM